MSLHNRGARHRQLSQQTACNVNVSQMFIRELCTVMRPGKKPGSICDDGTHRRIGHAAPRVGAAVRGAVAAREAPGRRHQPPARLHLLRGVHRT